MREEDVLIVSGQWARLTKRARAEVLQPPRGEVSKDSAWARVPKAYSKSRRVRVEVARDRLTGIGESPPPQAWEKRKGRQSKWLHSRDRARVCVFYGPYALPHAGVRAAATFSPACGNPQDLWSANCAGAATSLGLVGAETAPARVDLWALLPVCNQSSCSWGLCSAVGTAPVMATPRGKRQAEKPTEAGGRRKCDGGGGATGGGAMGGGGASGGGAAGGEGAARAGGRSLPQLLLLSPSVGSVRRWGGGLLTQAALAVFLSRLAE